MNSALSLFLCVKKTSLVGHYPHKPLKRPKFAAKIYLYLFFTLACVSVSAQTIIHGAVKDKAGKAIAGASVMITGADSLTVLTFTSTGANGEFVLKVPPAPPGRLLKVSLLGYRPFYRAYKPGDENLQIKLEQQVNLLKEINIRSQNVLTKTGDTLNYNVNAFAKSQDRTIGDVIKNLPGVTVSANGQISYNGRPINKFYIDNDDLLGSKYNLASETIPVDAVEKIQILENHQPVKVLKNFIKSDQAALNLKLKSSARLRAFGAGDVGAGLPNAQKVDVNDMLFRKDLKFLNTVSYNNIGNDLSYAIEDHTLEDFFDDFERPVSRQVLDTKTIIDPQIDRQRWLFNKSGLITGNTLLKFKNDNSLRINAYYKPGLYGQDYNSSTVYFLSNGTLNQREVEHSETRGKTIDASLDYERNSKNIYLENKLDIDLQNQTVNAGLNSESGYANQLLTNRRDNVQNNFKIIKPFSKVYLLEITSKTGYNSFPENLLITPGIFPVLLNDSVPYHDAAQALTKSAFYSRNKASLGINGGRFKQSYELGDDFERARFNSDILIEQNNGATAILPADFQNDATWKNNNLYLNNIYTYGLGPLSLNARVPLNFRSIHFNDAPGNGRDTAINAFIFSPALSVKWDIDAQNVFNIGGGRYVNFGEPEDILPGGIIANYRTIYHNGSVLNRRESVNTNANYAYRDPIKVFFTSVGLNYSTSTNSTLNRVDLLPNGLVDINRQIYNNTSTRLMLLGNASKYLFSLKTTVKLNINASESHQYQIENGVLLLVKDKSLSVGGDIDSKPSAVFNWDYHAEYVLANSSSGVTSYADGGQVKSFLQKLTFTCFIKSNLYFQAFNELQLLNSTQTNANIFFNDAKLSYSLKKKKMDISLVATNTFNRRIYTNESIDLNSSEITQFRLRPRTVFLEMRFIF